MRLILATLICSALMGQSVWCPEGECAPDCPNTLFALRYDWWWCSCPTGSECAQSYVETCTRCVISMPAWCDDWFNPYCHTYFLTGYENFCGCAYGQAGIECLPPLTGQKLRNARWLSHKAREGKPGPKGETRRKGGA